MRTSVRELKDHLSDYLRRVQQGEEIVVTSHNRPVAKLVPLSEAEAKTGVTRAQFLTELETLHEALSGAVKGESMSRVVTRMRQEERY